MPKGATTLAVNKTNSLLTVWEKNMYKMQDKKNFKKKRPRPNPFLVCAFLQNERRIEDRREEGGLAGRVGV